MWGGGVTAGRTRSGYYESLSLQAAALLQSLIRNHAFVDGNKRVAIATCAIFLLMNGLRLRCTADEGEAFLCGEVIGDQAEVAEIAGWLEDHMEKRTD